MSTQKSRKNRAHKKKINSFKASPSNENVHDSVKCKTTDSPEEKLQTAISAHESEADSSISSRDVSNLRHKALESCQGGLRGVNFELVRSQLAVIISSLETFYDESQCGEMSVQRCNQLLSEIDEYVLPLIGTPRKEQQISQIFSNHQALGSLFKIWAIVLMDRPGNQDQVRDDMITKVLSLFAKVNSEASKVLQCPCVTISEPFCDFFRVVNRMRLNNCEITYHDLEYLVNEL